MRYINHITTSMIVVLFAIIFLFLPSPLAAQLLWRISGRGVIGDSYLFATHHLVSSVLLSEVPGVFRAYNESDCVVGELLIDEQQFSSQLMSAAISGEDFRRYMSPAEVAFVDSAVSAVLHAPLSSLCMFRPSVVDYMYSLSLSDSLIYSSGHDPLDSFFQKAALLQGMNVHGLETIDDQLSFLLHSKSIEDQVRDLVATISHSDCFPTEYERLLHTYLSFDLDSLFRLGIENLTQAEQFLLIENRNEQWVKALIPLIRTQRCFIAVGALHLPGSHGLISLLRKKGYIVRPVR